ncbi:MAG TPA: hypothetical protein DGD08_01850 [Gemmatimonas aurantiaca]|uniref:Uncharacterized protein n=1 Tax=Gemmatimonas aurantiaca TaxID=173480 RepID=A0A3D4V6I9_9BACT|nr:hypothetical protein [Gemmatimonas aurantiaca]
MPITSRSISRRRFMGRLSFVEQVALNVMRANVVGDPELAAALQTLADLRDLSQSINLDDDDTIAGAQFSVQCLTALPPEHPAHITPEDAPSRIAAWLADYPQPGEPTT